MIYNILQKPRVLWECTLFARHWLYFYIKQHFNHHSPYEVVPIIILI